MKYDDSKTLSIWSVLSVLILAAFLIFVLYPLVLVLYKSAIDPLSGALTLDYFTRFFTKQFYWQTMVNSLQVTVCATILAAALGLPVAYLMRSVEIRGSSFLNILIVISYLSPPFIGAYAWIQLLGRSGVITQFINELFGITFDGVYGFAGIMLVFTLQSFPLVYIYVSGALKNMDNSLNEAAESLGCGRLERIRRIIVPLVMPTLLASMLLVFMRVFADFGTPMLIGEGFKTMPVLVYTQFMGEVGGDDGFAAAICVIMIGLTLAMFFAQRILARRSTYAMTALKPMVAERARGLRNLLAHAAVYLVTGLAILPQLVVIYTSFLRSNGGQVFTGGFALQSYEATLFAKDNDAVWNTYVLGALSIALVVVIGVLVAYLSVRKRNVVNSALDTVTMFPFIIPGSVLGIAFLFAFNSPPILISGTMLIMIIAFSVRRMPYTVRSSAAALGQISPSIEEAAISLGASEMTTFTRANDAAWGLRGCNHELGDDHQRAQLLHHSLYKCESDADGVNLHGGHSRQLRKCLRLCHHPHGDVDSFASPLLQGHGTT